MKYTVAFSKQSEKQFKALTKQVQSRLKPKIDALADNPRPHRVEKMEGADGLYRIRVGDYRIIYQIRDDVLLVLLLKIGDRKEIYR